jgi:transposase
MKYCIGLDISKRLIAVHIPVNNLNLEIENSINGIKKLYSKIKKIYKQKYKDLVFIYEPTGSYSKILTKFCSDKMIKCFMINPKQFSNHSKALGQRVKSDKYDAITLSKAIHLAKEDEIRVPTYDKTSGSSIKTKPKISKAGSKLYRGSLFLCVMSAVKYDENFKALYHRLKERGKHTTLVQIAIMRKMIILAHSLYKNNKKYDKMFYKKALNIEQNSNEDKECKS